MVTTVAGPSLSRNATTPGTLVAFRTVFDLGSGAAHRHTDELGVAQISVDSHSTACSSPNPDTGLRKMKLGLDCLSFHTVYKGFESGGCGEDDGGVVTLAEVQGLGGGGEFEAGIAFASSAER